MMSWTFFKFLSASSPKGPPAKWFKALVNWIGNQTRPTSELLRTPSLLFNFLEPIPADKRNKPFFVYREYDTQVICFGKALEYISSLPQNSALIKGEAISVLRSIVNLNKAVLKPITPQTII